MSFKIIILFTGFFCSLIFAQQNEFEKDTVYILDPVVISARSENSVSNLPYAVNLVPAEEITGSRGFSLEENLFTIPGIIISNRNNPSMGDRISIRGIGSRASFGVRGIKIIYDGIPLTLPDGQSQLTNIDFSSLGSVEILRGPASNLYGNSAGGIINIKSENPSDEKLNLNPSFTAGSFGFYKYNLKASGNIEKFSYLISLNKFLYNGFRDHSSAESFQINSNISYNISNNVKVKTIINYFDSPYLLNPSSLTKNDAKNSPEFARDFIKSQGAGEKASQGEYGINFNYIYDENFSNNTTVYFIHRSLINPIPGRIINLNRKAGGLRTFFDKKFTGNLTINLKGGFDFEFQNDTREEFDNNGIPQLNIKAENIFENLNYGSLQINQQENVIGAAPFVSIDFLINKKLGLHAGLRYDNFTFKITDYFFNDGDDSGERNINNLSPMAGIIFNPNIYTKIYANYSTSFQTPTTSELSNKEDGSGGFNPLLKPELIKSYEAGFRGVLPDININYESAFYLMEFNDMLISYQSQITGSEEIFFKNAGKARNIGAEFRLNWFPDEDISLSISYSYMDFTFRDYLVEINNENGLNYFQLKGNKVPGVSPNIFSAGFSYNFPFNFLLKLKAGWFDGYYVNDFNGPVLGTELPVENFINDSYAYIDAIIGYSLNINSFITEIFIGVNNIFDARYNASIVPNAAGNRFFEPSPGRNWYLKVQVSF